MVILRCYDDRELDVSIEVKYYNKHVRVYDYNQVICWGFEVNSHY